MESARRKQLFSRIQGVDGTRLRCGLVTNGEELPIRVESAACC
jgi:hypothetical protein